MKRRDDGIDIGGKAPSFPFYPGDFMRDMQTCTAAARGVWITLLCEMHFSPQRGYLIHANGRPWTVEDIARLVHLPVRNTRIIVDELRRKGVFSELPVDPQICESTPGGMNSQITEPATIIYSRRMAKDTAISEARRKAVNSRSDRQLRLPGTGESGVDTPLRHADFVGTKSVQNPLLSSSSSFSSSLSSSSSNCDGDSNTNSEPEPAAPGRSRVEPITEAPAELMSAVEGVLRDYVDAAKLSLELPPPKSVVRRISHLLVKGRVRAAADAFDEYMLISLDSNAKPRTWRWFEVVTEKAIKEGKFEQTG